MRHEEMAHNYYRWLLDKIHFRQYGSYERVLNYLFHTEFYWVVPMDHNRYEGGLALRDDFAMEQGYPIYFWRGYLPNYCTVLEMMISLAQDCEDRIMGDPDFGDRTHVWFWLMMDKVGLDELHDHCFNRFRAEQIVTTILDRTFSPDGNGGLFGRLSHPGDMREIEWWYQLNYYLDEYYQFQEMISLPFPGDKDFLSERICHQCGKPIFIPDPQKWAYKALSYSKKTGKSRATYFCSS